MREANVKGLFAHWQHQLREPSLTALLIAEALYIFVVIPLGVVIPLFSALLSSVVVLFIVVAIITLSGKREVTFIILTAIVVGQAAILISGQDRSLLTTWLNAGTKLLAVVALSWLVLTVVFGPGRVTLHRVRGAIILYLNT